MVRSGRIFSNGVALVVSSTIAMSGTAMELASPRAIPMARTAPVPPPFPTPVTGSPMLAQAAATQASPSAQAQPATGASPAAEGGCEPPAKVDANGVCVAPEEAVSEAEKSDAASKRDPEEKPHRNRRGKEDGTDKTLNAKGQRKDKADKAKASASAKGMPAPPSEPATAPPATDQAVAAPATAETDQPANNAPVPPAEPAKAPPATDQAVASPQPGKADESTQGTPAPSSGPTPAPPATDPVVAAPDAGKTGESEPKSPAANSEGTAPADPAQNVAAPEKKPDAPADSATPGKDAPSAATDTTNAASTQSESAGSTAGTGQPEGQDSDQARNKGKNKGKKKAERARARAAEEQAGTEKTTPVDKESVQAATESGQDVVVEEKTSTEDLAAIEASRQQSETAAANLDELKPVEVKEEVVTEATTRTSGEEALPVAPADDAAKAAAKSKKAKAKASTNASASAAPAEDKDDNQTWKLLGAAAAGAVVGALIPQLGGRVVQDQGDRMIVERDGEFYVRKDENLLLRRPGVKVQTEEFEGGIVRTTVNRDDGSQVITVRDAGGFILKRTRIRPDGTQVVLIDETARPRERRVRYVNPDRAHANYRPVDDRRYDDLDYSRSSRGDLRRALTRGPVLPIEGTYTLRDVRENGDLRTLVPGVDLDTVHFATGSSAVDREQALALQDVGLMMAAIIADNPREVFLVEGHTDAVGSNLTNLALSDRRAEAVALALTEYYGVPPENLVVQGYGERYLKVDTQGPSAANRRATVRRITPLIHRVAASG